MSAKNEEKLVHQAASIILSEDFTGQQRFNVPEGMIQKALYFAEFQAIKSERSTVAASSPAAPPSTGRKPDKAPRRDEDEK
jgi:hypothetical protein